MVSAQRVVAAAAERVATAYPSKTQESASHQTVPFQRLDRVFGAGGKEPTGWRKQGRDESLVAFQQRHQEPEEPASAAFGPFTDPHRIARPMAERRSRSISE